MHNSAPKLYFRVLGKLDIESSGDADPAPVLAQPKRLALLAYLALAAGGAWLRRDRVVAVFWPELDSDRARAALRDALYFLRRHLGDVIATRGSHDVALDLSRIRIDALDFQRHLDEGALDRAIDVYTGDLLDGLHVGGETEFDEWADTERYRLRELVVDAARRRALELTREGDVDGVARVLTRARELAPYDESLLHLLLSVYEQRGDPHGGAAEFRRFAERLDRDVGATPSPELTERASTLKSGATPVGFPIVEQPAAARTTAAPARATPERKRRRLTWPVATIAVALAIAMGPFALRKLFSGGGTPTLAPADVVILPFTIHGGTDADYLAEGFVDLLGAKLDGAGGVRAVDPHALFAVLEGLEGTMAAGRAPDLAVARAVAARFSAENFVLGSVVAAGTSLQVTVYLYNDAGALLTRADGVVESHAELFGLVDDLARRLLAGLRERSAPLEGLAAVTTSSLPALREYLNGERSFRAGDYNGSIAAFERAVAHDTSFALAYYRLSSAADWVGRADVAERALRRALLLRDRLPADGRDLVTARWEYWFGDARRAETLYRQITAAQPTDVESWFELSEVLFHAGPWMGRSLAESEAPLRHVLQLDERHIGAMVHLARVAALTRRLPLLDTLVTRVARIDSTHTRNFEMRALRLGLAPDEAAASALLDAISVSRDLSVPGSVAERTAVYTGNIVLAERIARVAAAPGRSAQERTWSLPSLAHLLASQGRWTEARAVIDELARADAAAAAHVRANVLTSGIVAPGANDLTAARAALLAATPDEGDDVPSADVDHLESPRRFYYLGMLDLLTGGTAETYIDELERPRADADRSLFATSHAALLRARRAALAGDSAEALRIVEADWLPPRKPLMVGWAWSHSNATARLFRAQLLERAGRCEDGLAWVDAVYEDIGGSPLLFSQVHALRGRCLEALGRREEAASAYRSLQTIRRRADQDQRQMLGDAAAAIDRLAGK